jgi:hypothetical protein
MVLVKHAENNDYLISNGGEEMKPETLKAKLKEIEWHRIETDFTMPFSQGELINALLKRYFVGKGKRPRVLKVGWHMDIVAIKTPRQIMAWKDTGIGGRFLGIYNYLDNTVTQHPDDEGVKQKLVFKSFKELRDTIDKRDFNNILGLKAKIAEKDYINFLEVLPPMKVTPTSFVLSEALTDQMYYQFSNTKEGYFAEVVKLEDEEIEAFERAR